MGQSNISTKKAFWMFTALGVMTAAAVSYGMHRVLGWSAVNFPKYMENELMAEKLSFVQEQAIIWSQNFYSTVLPIVSIATVLICWLMWMALKIVAKGSAIEETASEENRPEKSKKDFIDRKLEQERRVRLFLHSLSVLQRDGRLLDFFEEDLSLYEDEQIGAAVRSIQEDCKNTMKKYINLKPVISEEEGNPITIEEGFDIDSITLTGNVSGNPPFEGVVKHRGWKAGKRELPKLSDIRDATLIVPAEVEIQ